MTYQAVIAEIDLTPEPPAFAPRLLSAREAAYYCGVGIASWNQWVGSGKVPPALPGTRRWDRTAIDQAIDRLSGISASVSQVSALDEWSLRRARQA